MRKVLLIAAIVLQLRPGGAYADDEVHSALVGMTFGTAERCGDFWTEGRVADITFGLRLTDKLWLMSGLSIGRFSLDGLTYIDRQTTLRKEWVVWMDVRGGELLMGYASLGLLMRADLPVPWLHSWIGLEAGAGVVGGIATGAEFEVDMRLYQYEHFSQASWKLTETLDQYTPVWHAGVLLGVEAAHGVSVVGHWRYHEMLGRVFTVGLVAM